MRRNTTAPQVNEVIVAPRRDASPARWLVESLGPAPILLHVTYRPEYQHGWGSKTSYSQVRLDALADESEAKLLDALLGEDPALAPLKRLLVKAGNLFFFLEETVRTLMETEVQQGSPSLSRSIETIEVPATVQGWRIDRLSQEDKRLLQVAAVVGKQVPFYLLRAMPELPDEAMRGALASKLPNSSLRWGCFRT